MNKLKFTILMLLTTLTCSAEVNCDSCLYDQNDLIVVLKMDFDLNSNAFDYISSIVDDNIKYSTVTRMFPYSKNDTLSRTFLIKTDGNSKQLFDYFSRTPQSVLMTERVSKPLIKVMSDYDPTDYFWNTTQSNPQGDLWHLKKIEAGKAWDLNEGHKNTKIAFLDFQFDINHPDLKDQVLSLIDPTDGSSLSCSGGSHGTIGAGFIAAEVDGGGDLAGIGFNCKLILVNTSWTRTIFLQKAQYASLVLNADVITSSAAPFKDVTTNFSTIEQIATKEILDHGTVIVWPAGNGFDDGAHPNDGHSMTPLSAYYDERVIVVTSTDDQDKHYFFNNSPINPAYQEWTHSHFPEVDVAAPGYLTMGATCTTSNPTHPYYWACHGTSFSTPIVAGLAGLIKSVNPCFTPADVQHIIKTTTDPIVDEANYSGLVGTGRINAYQAVLKALTYKAMYEQNKTYIPNTLSYTRRRHTIMLGYSVTGSIPVGWATIQNGANVNYIARNYIEAKPGFESQQGSGFEWRINPDLDVCDGENDDGIDDPIDPGEIEP